MDSVNEVTQATGPGGRPKLPTWMLIALAGLVAGGAGLWLGQSASPTEWPDDARPVPKAAVAVTAAATPAAPPPVETVRGIINAAQESTVASRLTARIVEMPFGEGESFAAGALLARFDCSQIQAELNAAQAAAVAYRKSYDTNVELDQYEAVGKNEVAVSRANLGKAEAEAKAVAAQLNDCAVRAPLPARWSNRSHVKARLRPAASH